MRIAPVLVAVPLLIVLLTWLSLRAANSDAEQFDVALGEMDRVATLEAALLRDVLSARAGLLRNYDPLVREADALDDVVALLRSTAERDPTMQSGVRRLALSVLSQDGSLERFKSDNALLQNSLAYFTVFSSHQSSSGLGDPLVPAASALAAAMLRLTLDTSAASAAGVGDRLDEFARLVPPAGDAAWAKSLLGHGRLLHDLIPATDGMLRALNTTAFSRERDQLRTAILTQQAASRATARKFWVALYLTSLMLVCLVAYVGLRLRARARALRRHAAIEHVIVGISMRFLSAKATDNLDTSIEQALADLAQCVGADRAYSLLSGSSARTYTWCRQGVAFPPGWPDQALRLMDERRPTMGGIVHIRRVARLPLGTYRHALASFGVEGWACISRKGACGSTVLLGFDAVTHPCRMTSPGELSLLQMGLDVITNAIFRRLAEQDRSRLEMRLQQAQRLETVGALASGIAHNFNNIVGAILGYTEMADEQDTSPGILHAIRRAGERARELVDQILTFARRRDVRRDPMSVQLLVAEAASLLRASLPATAELVVRATQEEMIVCGASAQLQQVILNLCNNAAQAMDYHGRIELEVEAKEVATPCSLSHGALAPGRYVQLGVSDTGRGIGRATLERIFEPFFTTRVTGTGLGLATTRDIVREHGGAMNVQSSAGVGSRFEVWLPRIAAPASAASDGFVSPPFGRGETVLIVEDDPEQLLRDEEVLAALGYEPVGFTCMADARAACLASPGRFDLAVVGPLVPTTASFVLAVALHEIAPALPILLAAASVDEFEADALLTAGISDVIPWPIIATEIATALQDCLRRRNPQANRS